jgi:hypothetical protein
MVGGIPEGFRFRKLGSIWGILDRDSLETMN